MHKIISLSFLYVLAFFLTQDILGQTIEEEKENKVLSEAYSYITTSEKEKTFKLCHQILTKTKSYNSKVKALIMLGQYHNKKNNLDSAMYYGNKFLEISNGKTGEKQLRRLARVYNIFAIANNQKGLYDKAASWHIKGINISEKGNDKPLFYTHKHGLANIYRIQKKYDKALAYFKDCLHQNINIKFVYASHINIGVLLSSQGKYKESIIHLTKALDLCTEANNLKCIIVTNLNLGENYEEENNLPKALFYYQKVKDETFKNGFTRLNLTATLSIARIFIKTKSFNDAEALLTEALYKAANEGLLALQTEIYDQLINLNKQRDKYQLAYRWLSEKNKIKDSISFLQKDKEIQDLKVKYEALEKDKEIAVLKKDNLIRALELSTEKKYRNILIVTFFLVLIPVIIILFLNKQKLLAQKKLIQKEKEFNFQKITSLIQNQELKLVKASIEGQHKERKKIAQDIHDSIGGNIASIKLQLIGAQKENIDINNIVKQLNETYEEVRTISHDLIPSKFLENDFTVLLEEHTNNISKASNISIDVHSYPKEEINTLDYEIQNELFSILQELITNTIKHGEASQIAIEFNLINNALNLLFEDNGVGFEYAKDETTLGIGLKNIKNRVVDLFGIFKIDTEIGRGTIVNIEIPVN